MPKASKPPFTITPVKDFDGDGVVISADIVKYAISPTTYIRLTFNSGSHQTTVELNPDDLSNMAWLIGKAQKAVTKPILANAERRKVVA